MLLMLFCICKTVNISYIRCLMTFITKLCATHCICELSHMLQLLFSIHSNKSRIATHIKASLLL